MSYGSKHFQLKVVNWWSSSYHNSDICLSNNFRTQHFSIMTGSWGGVTDSRHDAWPAGDLRFRLHHLLGIAPSSVGKIQHDVTILLVCWQSSVTLVTFVACTVRGQRAVRGLPARTPYASQAHASTPRTTHRYPEYQVSHPDCYVS